MTERTRGTLATLLATVTWGLSPLYYHFLGHVPAGEVLSHRVLWSFVSFFALVLLRHSLPGFRALLRPGGPWKTVIGASLMVGINWMLFIWAVQQGRVLETSLGYFTFPLISVAFGFFFFGERPRTMQWIAIGLAALAVLILTLRLGALPWLPLTLGISFAFYGVMKKRLDAGPIASVTAETLFMLPPAVIWLVGVELWGWGGTPAQPAAVFGHDLWISVLLLLSGIITAGPLILVSYGAQRLPLATIGVLMYINPSLQFLCAVALLGEVLTPAHIAAFGLIWAALAIYSVSEYRRPTAPPRPVPQPS